MGYRPRFEITPALLGRVEAVAALRERIQGAAVHVAALQKDTRARNAHSSTAIGKSADARAGPRGGGGHVPPPPGAVPGLVRELLDWWNDDAPALSPVLSSAIVHYRFEAIHPFADGNGHTGRALALWELYRRGFDTHHIFSVDEYYWEDRPRYYATLAAVQDRDEDLTAWLEYCAEGLQQTLERVWQRIQQFSAARSGARLVLRPKQEQLLQLLRARGSLSPREIWDGLAISKQGAMDLIRPLVKAKLIKRVGALKNGRYVLR
jgi:Fic family protein